MDVFIHNFKSVLSMIHNVPIFQLNDQLKQENERRRQECKELYEMLTKDRQKMSEDLLRETSQVRDILDKDKKARLEERSCQDKEVNKLIPIAPFKVALNVMKRFLENISSHHLVSFRFRLFKMSLVNKMMR